MSGTTPNNDLAQLPGKRIAIVGDVILDEYVWGDVTRISPEAPVPVIEIRRRTQVPGGAANVAANVARLGGSAMLAGVVGHDNQADRLGDALREIGVDPGGLIADSGRPTTTKTRVIAHSQQAIRMDAEERAPIPRALEDALLHWLDEQLPGCDGCVLSDYAKGVVSPRLARHFIAAALAHGKPIVVDPKGTDNAKYRGATVVKPNLHEAQRFLQREIGSGPDFLEAGQELADRLPGTAVLLTRGAQGMSLFRQGLPPTHFPTVARNVFDVTGAGDTVTSTLAVALAAKLPIERAIHLANRAAGIVVGKLGTATVTLEELSLAEA
jgi:rfaE bifunctional protein kinase chain/domain